MSLTIRVLPGPYSVCRLPADAPMPRWPRGMMVSIGRTEQELSIVCESEAVPEGVVQSPSWRCLRLDGPLPLDAVGILSSILGPLAQAGVNIMAVSTYDTDHVLVPESKLELALLTLTRSGFKVVR